MKVLASVCGVVAALSVVGMAAGQEKEEKRTIHDMTVVLIDTRTRGFSGGTKIKEIEIPKETVAKKTLAGVKDKQGEIKEANREWPVKVVKMKLPDDSVVEVQVLILKETGKRTLTNVKNLPLEIMSDAGKGTWYGYYAEYDVPIDSSPENVAQAKKDMEGLQGTWRVLASQTGPQPEKKELLKKLKVVVKGDKMTLIDPNALNPIEGTIKLDPKTKAFDWKVRLGITFTMMGIYELKGDDVRIYFGESQPFERVSTFDFKGGQLYVLKREKP